jgi:threonine synthase
VTDVSAAVEQHPVSNLSVSYPLTPPLTTGPPGTDREDLRPLEVGYDYDLVDTSLFDCGVGPGIDRWQPLLPPLAGAPLGAARPDRSVSRRGLSPAAGAASHR